MFVFQHNEMKTCVSFLTMCHQSRSTLNTKYGLQGEAVREKDIAELDERMKILRVRMTEKEKSRYSGKKLKLILVMALLLAA